MSNPDHLGASGNLRGILAMMAGMFGFVTNDMFAKLASETLPTGQIMFIRGVFTIAIIFAIAWASGALAKLRELRRPAVGLRTIGEVFSTVFFLTALFNAPIANATAILQTAPIAVTAAAALLLREAVGWRRWLAIGVGFLGMLLIVQPGGAGFNPYALFAVAAVFFITLRDLATRRLPLVVPAILVSLVTSIAVTGAGAVLGVAETWVVPDATVLGMLFAAAICLTGGYFFVVEGVRHGEVSVVSPFRYTILIPAFVYGIVIWGDALSLSAAAGIGLVVGSGVYVLYRESLVRRAAAAAARP